VHYTALTARRPDLPIAAEQVVLKALEKDPRNRYASIQLLLMR